MGAVTVFISSLVVAVIASWLTSQFALRRAGKERASSLRAEAYMDLTRAAYAWARTIHESNVAELEELTGALTKEMDVAYSRLEDAMFMLQTVASPKSFQRVSDSFEEVREVVSSIDADESENHRIDHSDGLKLHLAISNFVETASNEMRTYITR